MNRSILACMLLAVGTSAVFAQPAPKPAPFPAPTPAPAPPATDTPAEQAYQRGRKHYDLQEWDQAIAEFKEAYRLRNDAASLFNIAQSYRLKGDCAQALAFYKTYRRNYPEAQNISRVEQFITEMDECAKRTPATNPTTTGTTTGTDPNGTTGTTGTGTDTTGTGTTGTGTTGTTGTGTTGTGSTTGMTAPVERVRAQPTLGHIGIGITTVGVASIVGGVVFALRAQSIEADIIELPRWDPDLHDRGERADLMATVLFAVGGAAVIGGGVMMYLGYRTVDRSREHNAVSVVPTAGGASIRWSTRF